MNELALAPGLTALDVAHRRARHAEAGSDLNTCSFAGADSESLFARDPVTTSPLRRWRTFPGSSLGEFREGEEFLSTAQAPLAEVGTHEIDKRADILLIADAPDIEVVAAFATVDMAPPKTDDLMEAFHDFGIDHREGGTAVAAPMNPDSADRRETAFALEKASGPGEFFLSCHSHCQEKGYHR